VVSTTFFWLLLPFYGGIEALGAFTPSQLAWLVISVLGLLVIGDTLYFRAMDLAGVSWAMPVSSINPLWAVLLAALLIGEPLSWSLVLGALLVVAGIILVSRSTGGVNNGRKIEPKARRLGLLMALAASVLWAIGQVALKPGTDGVHTVVANSIRQPLGALLLLVPNLFRGQWRELRSLDRRSWGIIVLASLIGTGLGTFLFIIAIQMSGAGRTAILASTAPLMAVPFSMMWMGERPTRLTFAGTLLTTFGIALVL
jgi:DME family drug/metabolite transporter